VAASDKTGGTERRRQTSSADKERGLPHVEKAVQEQYRLLEKYAPAWYTQEHHVRAEQALRKRGESLRAVFSELCDLLEQYGPTWFTEEHHAGAEAVRKLLNECAASSGRKDKPKGRGAGA
jgi:hypothetical protein